MRNMPARHSFLDARQTAVQVVLDLVLPDSHHLPPHRPKSAEIAPVPPAVASDFRLPERGQSLRPERQAVAVPEISVQEDDDFADGGNHVWPAGKILDMLAEARAAPKKSVIIFFKSLFHMGL